MSWEQLLCFWLCPVVSEDISIMGNTACMPRQLKLTDEDIKFLQENTEMEAKDIKVRIHERTQTEIITLFPDLV